MNPRHEATLDKAALRRAMLACLQELTAEERDCASEKICAQVAASAAWRRAQRVLLFSAMLTEPQIAPLLAAAIAAGRETFVIPPTLRVESELVLPFAPDLVLVPGLAFSRDNHRLGRGGGFYDRLLSGRTSAAYKLGVCFNIQLRDKIPEESHDIIVDAVVTD